MTYTVATMEVSAEAFDEISEKLRAAGYDHCFDEAGLVDMTHIALVRGGQMPVLAEMESRKDAAHDSQAYLFADLPPYTKPWDGHTTEEKYARLVALPVRNSDLPAHWRELIEQLVACHEEPSCPAVDWARDWLKNGPKCACGERPPEACPGAWEQGCDLGANEKHVRISESQGPVSALEPYNYDFSGWTDGETPLELFDSKRWLECLHACICAATRQDFLDTGPLHELVHLALGIEICTHTSMDDLRAMVGRLQGAMA